MVRLPPLTAYDDGAMKRIFELGCHDPALSPSRFRRMVLGRASNMAFGCQNSFRAV
jgi:hypothetical protein